MKNKKKSLVVMGVGVCLLAVGLSTVLVKGNAFSIKASEIENKIVAIKVKTLRKSSHGFLRK